MERSDEVRGFVSSLLETFGTPEMGQAFRDAMASEAGTLLIGTDPAEWWDSRDALLRALAAQSQELQGAVATVTHADGWREGDVGWAAAKLDVSFAGGPSAHLRFTATAVSGDDGWKIVQGHVSMGAANEEVVGKELTV